MKLELLAGAVVIGMMALTGAAMAHEMDIDQDGLYTLAELRSEYPDLTEADYAALDTNQDEAVDAAELAAAIAEGRLAPME